MQNKFKENRNNKMFSGLKVNAKKLFLILFLTALFVNVTARISSELSHKVLHSYLAHYLLQNVERVNKNDSSLQFPFRSQQRHIFSESR